MLPAIVASIENYSITLTDTQLVMEDDQQNMLVYPEPELADGCAYLNTAAAAGSE